MFIKDRIKLLSHAEYCLSKYDNYGAEIKKVKDLQVQLKLQQIVLYEFSEKDKGNSELEVLKFGIVGRSDLKVICW